MYDMFALVLGISALLSSVHCTPLRLEELQHIDVFSGVDARSDSDTCVQSVYICQN